jgi:hypothetical protein
MQGIYFSTSKEKKGGKKKKKNGGQEEEERKVKEEEASLAGGRIYKKKGIAVGESREEKEGLAGYIPTDGVVIFHPRGRHGAG